MKQWSKEEKSELEKVFIKIGKLDEEDCVEVSRKINRTLSATCAMAARMGYLNNRKLLEKKPCKLCGKLFHPFRRHVELCSVSCRALFQSNKAKEKYPETKTCLTCGAEFQAERSHKGAKVKHCSKQCVAANARKHTKPAALFMASCLKCGIDFTYRMGKRGKFCSRKCSEKRLITIESARYAINRKNEVVQNPHSNRKSGWVEIGGKRFYSRSSWEKKYAEFLQLKKESGEISDWHYEAERFWFEKTNSNVRSYLPDFLVINKDGSKEYHEVKGFMCNRSKESIRLMGDVFPSISLKVLDGKWFRENGLL